ncbi:signal recognition particle domain protein, partial [Cystoisospora suis]
MQAAMASQAEGQRVLLVIDHFSLHAAATVHLKESLRRFLSSPSVACHLPSLPVKAFHSSSTKTYTTETFPASRHKEASPGSPSAILPFASMASYVGQLVGGNDSSTLPTTLLSRDKLHSSSLSLLITLDTPPGVRTPGSTSGGGGDLLRQQRQLGEVLKSVIGGDSGIGEALLRRSIEETQEALVSSVDQSIFFSYPESLLAQQSRGKSTVLSPRGKKCSSQQNPVTAMGPVYPMIDLESLLVLNSSSSPPLLVADGCAVLSASCFSPALQENFPQSSSSQALIEALKDICRRRYLSLSKATTQRHNIARSSFHTLAPQKGDDVDSSGVHTPQGGTREIGASNAKSSAVYNEKHSMEQQGKISPTERSFFSPQPALITCVAASAFAWQQRILRMQTERQAMMATLKIFVDTWEVEDLASLQIAAGVCTAQRAGRVFSQAEQVILLRAAATLLFAPPTEEIEERFSHTAHHPTSSFSPFSSSSTPQRRDFPLFSNSGERIVTFDEACSFQEEILRLFKEENFHTFRMLETYLSCERYESS